MSDPNENGPRLTSRPVGAVSEETSLLHAEKYTLPQGDQQGGQDMTDNITLPREVVVQTVKVLSPMAYDTWPRERNEVVATLRVHLAAPRPEPRPSFADPEPSGYAYRYNDGVLRFNGGSTINGAPPIEVLPYWFAPPAAAPRPEPVRHPGYVIGNHWLETAYERLCAGEAEADVLKDCGWERVGEALRRENERLRGLLEKIVAADDDPNDKLTYIRGRLLAEIKAALRREDKT